MKRDNLKTYRKKRVLIVLAIVAFLAIGRLILPFYLKKYVNTVLADIPGYYGQVEDIDMSLFRGAYTINNLYLNKIDTGIQVPLIDIEKTNISVEWKSLFKGKVVSEVVMTRPKFTYVFEAQKKNNSTTTQLNDWTKALTDLVPININTLQIVKGKIGFVQLSSDPNIDLYFDQVYLEAKNLRNVLRTDQKLPSSVKANAVSIGKGKITLTGKLDLVKKNPDIDVSFSLENANVVSLNDFTNHYVGIDFKEGKYNIYSEVAIADEFLKGYIKPMLIDTKLISKKDNFLDILWEGFAGFFKFLLKNHGQNTLATKIPLEGDLKNVQGDVWISVCNIFKNAWIKAFTAMPDNSVNFEDVQKVLDKEKK